MRFYIKRLRQFETVNEILDKYYKENPRLAMERSIEYLKRNFVNPVYATCRRMTSFRNYILPKRKKRRRRWRGDVYKFRPRSYPFEELASDVEINNRYLRYLEHDFNARQTDKRITASSYYKRHGTYPYSRRRPNPPISPELINIQSGKLNKGFTKEIKSAANYGSVIIKFGNNSPHFYFITHTMVSGTTRMMGRPFLDALTVYARKIANITLPKVHSLFSTMEYKR